MKPHDLFSMAATASLFVLGASVVPAAAAEVAPSFAGHWRVAGVAVSDTGINALVENDPSLMGRQLTFSSARLAWDRPLSTKDVCIDPQFTRLRTAPPSELRPQLRKLRMPDPTPFAIHCKPGSWGPARTPMIFRGAGGVLALPWYDGGLLELVRQ